MKKRHYGKYIFRWLMTLLLLAGLVFAGIGGTRLLHIYLTSTGRQAAVCTELADSTGGEDLRGSISLFPV